MICDDSFISHGGLNHSHMTESRLVCVISWTKFFNAEPQALNGCALPWQVQALAEKKNNFLRGDVFLRREKKATPQVMNSAQPAAADVGNKLRQAQTKQPRLRRLLKRERKCSPWAHCLERTVHRGVRRPF